MGAYSEIKITRDKARQELIRQLLLADDTELARLLDRHLSDRLYTCRIVENDAPNDDTIL